MGVVGGIQASAPLVEVKRNQNSMNKKKVPNINNKY
jgi:hypothetical protein